MAEARSPLSEHRLHLRDHLRAEHGHGGRVRQHGAQLRLQRGEGGAHSVEEARRGLELRGLLGEGVYLLLVQLGHLLLLALAQRAAVDELGRLTFGVEAVGRVPARARRSGEWSG